MVHRAGAAAPYLLWQLLFDGFTLSNISILTEDNMSKSFLRRLRKKHDVIDRKIAKKQKSPGQDPEKISELKKLKLSIKDQIARIEAASNSPAASAS